MLYQRKISRGDALSAKLAFQLQNARYVMAGAQTLGVMSCMFLLWYQYSPLPIPAWGIGMLVLSFLQSLHMGHALEKQRHIQNPGAVLREIMLSALLGGLAWSATVIWMGQQLSDDVLYGLVMVMVIITVTTVAATAVVREFYLVWLCATLIPVASFLGWEHAVRPFNFTFAMILTGLAMLMALLTEGISRSFAQMVESGLEREAMAADLAGVSDTLRAKNLQLQEARKQLADLAKLDELTGLRNRRGADKAFELEISRAQRAGAPLAVIMIDVDFFKAYNDNYGHPAGDDVLKQLAGVLRSVTSRAGELAIRMGGEEFLLLLPGTSQAEAMASAEKIRARIAELQIEHTASSVSSVVTVSQGVVACIPAMSTEFKQLLEAADQALYASKEGGRNGITLSAFRA